MAVLAGVVFGIIAAVCLAGQAITVRLATRRGRTVDVLFVVLLMNTVILVPLALLLVPTPNVTSTAIMAFVAAGLLSTVIARGCFYAGIKRIGASRAEPIKASMPLHATILAVLLLGETVTTAQFAGVVLIVVGVVLVSREGALADRATGEAIPLVGMALPLIGAFFYGLEPTLATIGLREGTPVLVGVALKSAAGAVFFIAYLAWRDSIPRPSDLPAGDLRWYVLAGLASTAFTLVFYMGLSVSRVVVVVPLMQTSPLIVTAALAVFVRDLERVPPRLVAAAGVVAAGAITVTLTG